MAPDRDELVRDDPVRDDPVRDDSFRDDTARRIAIVGMAGRFPGARDVRELWRNLCAGVESIRSLSDGELARAGVEPAALCDPRYVKASADLDDVELFDAPFFGFSRREASVTDPQQRLLLELAWEALEDAGHPPGGFPGAIAVFAGASRNDHLERVLADPANLAALGAFALQIGNDRDFLATRISYALGLTGPSLTVQTACSTSLVAVHLACQSLLAGECDMALAGGASVRLPQGEGYFHQDGGVASPDGHCRAFDARARGTVAGNGGALVVLRRLEDALADRDPIAAVILGTAVNNDGSAKVGFTAPSVRGQAAVIEEALAIAGVGPESVGYVEAHGTATPLGDPIEVAALTDAFRRRARAGVELRGGCALGSIKTNVGHLDAAAGVAGLVKAALALAHAQIPPSLHFERANPELALESSPFHVARELEAWPARAHPRRAGVSSFGIGGTNAHAVLEQAPEPESRPDATASDAAPQLLVLSARTPAALASASRRLAERLAEERELALADVAWTLQAGRNAFRERRALVARDATAAVEALRGSRGSSCRAPEGPRRVAFLFPGQGTQSVRMAQGLFESEPVFRTELEACARELRGHLDLDLLALLYPPRAQGPEAKRDLEAERAAEARLARTELTQPALFAVELALARTWIAKGFEPAALCGHSVGELVAACLAGVFSLPDALRLVAERGRAMQELPGGAMLLVALSEGELAPRLAPALAIASIQSAGSCIASGPADAIAALALALESEGVAARRLRTSHAFHSPMMEPAVRRFGAALERVRLAPPRIPVLSNTTGTWLLPAQACEPRYWAEHLLRPVRLAENLDELLRRGDLALLEVGPGRTFAALVRERRGSPGAEVVSSLPAKPGADERAFLLESIGRLWTQGVEVDWARLHGVTRRRLRLPTYPFQRSPLEGERDASGSRSAARETPAPLAASAPIAETSARSLVASVWSEVLGEEPWADGDEFFERGGSSLLAAQVLARLRASGAGELALADVLEATTLGALAARVERARRTAETRGASPLLVALAGGGPGIPIFLVPGLDGGVSAFQPLARHLARERPVFALRAPGLEPGEEPCASVQELAERHLAAIRARAPQGPYRLAGHSFGGFVALELARALRAAGEEVERLALLDTLAPDPARDPSDEGAWLARQLGLDDRSVIDPQTHALAFLRASAEGADEAELRRRARVVAAHACAAARYRPERLAGRARLVLASEGALASDPAVARGAWRSIVAELDVLAVPGDHLSMLAAPELASLLS